MQQPNAQPSPLGTWLSAAAALTGAAGSTLTFMLTYEPVLRAMAANGKPTGVTVVTYLFPLLTDLGLVGAFLWAVAAAGFRGGRAWALQVGLVACGLNVFSGFMPMPPTVSNHLFPLSAVLVLVPNLLFGLLLTRWVGRVPWAVAALLLLAVLAMCFSLINGIASTHRMLQGRGLVYILTERLHLLTAAGWLAFAAALLARRAWARSWATSGGLLAVCIGAPLGLADSLALGRFSLFAVSPLFSLLLVLLLWRGPLARGAQAWCAEEGGDPG